MPTTTKSTEKFISNHPSIKDCLKKGIINYSKLSRLIAKQLDLNKKTSMEAILIAARRYEKKLKKELILEEQIINLLNKSELNIKNKIVVIIIDKLTYPDTLLELEKKIKKNRDTFISVEGTEAITIITSEKYFSEIKDKFRKNILSTHKNCAMITIKCTKDLESIPGVTGFLYSKFAEHGVNIIETMSCWTDNIFIIDEKDTTACMEFLRF